MKLRTGKVIAYKSNNNNNNSKVKHECCKLRNGKVLNSEYKPFPYIDIENIYNNYITSRLVATKKFYYDEDCLAQFDKFKKSIQGLIKQSTKIIRYTSRIPLVINCLEILADNTNLFFSPCIVQNSSDAEFCNRSIRWLNRLLKKTHHPKAMERYTPFQLNQINTALTPIYSLWMTLQD
jgi:hypothetical protein